MLMIYLPVVASSSCRVAQYLLLDLFNHTILDDCFVLRIALESIVIVGLQEGMGRFLGKDYWRTFRLGVGYPWKM